MSSFEPRLNIDFQTGKTLFYIGLTSLAAILAFFYSPLLSCALIVILFIQRRYWKIEVIQKRYCNIENAYLSILTLIPLLPLLLVLSGMGLKQILLLLFNGVGSIGSDIYVKFPGALLDIIIYKTLITMMLIAISGMTAALLLLNIIFPIWKKFFRIIFSLLCIILIVPSLLFSFFSFLFTMLDLSLYLTGNYQSPVELIIDKNLNEYHVRAYRTDYEGALGAFGVEVKQEKDLPYGLKLVREISSYYHCDDVQLDVLDSNAIRIKPFIDSHETDPTLSLPKIFKLKSF